MALEDYDGIIKNAADEWNLDPAFLRAVIAHESNGNPSARSSAGAVGLGQLMPDTAMRLGVTNRYDPAQSIYGAAKYLDLALNTEGDPARALLYYHGGPGWRGNYGSESANYVPAVAKRYAQFASADTKKTATDAGSGDSGPSFEDVNKKAGAAPASTAPAAPASPTAPAASSFEDVSGKAGPAPASPQPQAEPPPYNPVHDFAVRMWNAPDKMAQLRTELQPDPGTTYGDILPAARPTGTDEWTRLAMPNFLRSGLQDITTPTPLSQGGGLMNFTVDESGKVTPALSAGSNLMLSAAAPVIANPLRMGALEPVPDITIPPVQPGSLEARAAARDALRPPEERVAAAPAPSSPTGFAPPPEAAPAAGPQPAGAQPAGAQITPPPAAARTAREISHANTVADEEWLNTPQQPGVKDTRVLVDGNTGTLAEQEQTVETARELKRLRNEHTEVSQDERGLLHDASENRKTAFKEAVPSDLSLNAAEDAAGKKIESDLQTVWANKGIADTAPVSTQIQAELSGSAGHLPPVKTAMQQVSDSLETAGTDPQALYKTHRLINYLQSKQGQIANPGYGAADVQAALTRVKGVLAKQIDTAAPGFGTAMKTYSDTIGPIRAAQALNERYSGLFDSRGYMNFNRVHELMKDVVQAGHPDAPTNDLRGISEFQLQRLKDIHDDLKRSASAQDLSKAYGSDTAQNVMDIIKGVGQTAGSLAVRAAAGYALGPYGPFAVDAAGRIIGARRAAARKAADVARGREILRPPAPNALQPPPP
jgi:hypothetical protein